VIIEEMSVFADEDRYILKPETNPYYQIRQTYYQMAKVHVFKLNVQKVEKLVQTAIKITVESQGDENELFVANCYRLLKEVQGKIYSQRNKEAINEAQKALDKAVAIIDTIVGSDKPNYIRARAMLAQGDIYVTQKKIDEAEKVVLGAQRMIGEIFSDNHPVILEFNANLVDVYSNKNDEADKLKTVQISEKNIEIAHQFYGTQSMFVIKHELALGSNKISNLMLQEAQDNIANIRKIVQHYHDDNPRDLMNQYLFLGQILVAITLMSTTSADSADRILSYVMMKQLEYVEGNRTHPFLEQVVTNLAILKRSQQDFNLSLQLFEQLRKIQEAAYGPESEVLIYTYKNIGVCYLAIAVPEKAEEYYLKALDLMSMINSGEKEVDEELLKDDREQLASIYFNLYLSSIQNDDKEKAKEYIMKALELNKLIHGVNSLQVSNGHFINAQLSLRFGKADEAIAEMLEAMNIFDH
jgi:tetratricopeptide (TPR) repeat protein